MSYEQKLDDYTRQQLAELATVHPEEAARLSVAYERAKGRARDDLGMQIENRYNEALVEVWRAAREKQR